MTKDEAESYGIDVSNWPYPISEVLVHLTFMQDFEYQIRALMSIKASEPMMEEWDDWANLDEKLDHFRFDEAINRLHVRFIKDE